MARALEITEAIGSIHMTRGEYDKAIEYFTRGMKLATLLSSKKNLAKIYDAVGDRVTAVFVTGTDFGTQNAPFVSPAAYRKLYQPFHRQVNDWIHSHTPWKSFIHSCGSVIALLPDIVDAGFQPTSELLRDLDSFESWSSICLEALFGQE